MRIMKFPAMYIYVYCLVRESFPTGFLFPIPQIQDMLIGQQDNSWFYVLEQVYAYHQNCEQNHQLSAFIYTCQCDWVGDHQNWN